MNAVVGIIVLAALLCLVTSRLRSRRSGGCQSRIRPLASKFVYRRRRQIAALQARELARAIIDDRPDPAAHLGAGVILQRGEDAWTRARARLAVRTGEATCTAYTQVSWLGRRAKNVTHESTTEQWRDHGEIEWLITSQRVVGRLPASTEMISIWWSGLDGVDIYIESDRIVFNGANGWTGMLSGPAVAPIAVAAIAMCHGLEALLVHPALEALRQQGAPQPPPQQSSSSREPETIGAGGTILRLPRRRPTR